MDPRAGEDKHTSATTIVVEGDEQRLAWKAAAHD